MTRLRTLFAEKAFVLAIGAIVCALAASVTLVMLHNEVSGPGDQIWYIEQAAKLVPFTNTFYGPSYFVALRVVHVVGHINWFASGKVLSLMSMCVYLVLCERLFRAVLSNAAHWLALALVALNAQTIAMGYAWLTISYGAAWMLGAVLVISKARLDQRRRWLFAGMLFGAAALVRFQANALLIGAIGGTLLLQGPIRARVRSALLLLIGAALPAIVWKVFLLRVQGFVPANTNVANLAGAAGVAPTLSVGTPTGGGIVQFLVADPARLVRVLETAAIQTARFPTDEGVQLLGLTVCWLVVGTLVLVGRRSTYSPWIAAMATGFVLTAIATNGWVYYYLPVLPGLVYVIANAIEEPGRERSPSLVYLGWAVAIAATLGWSAVQVPKRFRDTNWPEWAAARNYLNVRADSAPIVVSTSAGSLAYGARFRFIPYQDIMQWRDTPDFVVKLRERGVTHFVVGERHSLWHYPSQSDLLADTIRALPAGLVRDTLIVNPKRVAVFSIVPP